MSSAVKKRESALYLTLFRIIDVVIAWGLMGWLARPAPAHYSLSEHRIDKYLHCPIFTDYHR